MTPRTALAEMVGIMQADEILEALRTKGWIVVKHDAIRLAQREAVVEYREDNGWRPQRAA